METINLIIYILTCITSFLSSMYDYRTIYIITGLFATRKFKKAKNQHKYAVLVAARNEEKVIGNLIKSIKAQDYPNELVDIFVVADNCTDNTAEVSESLGAVCYKRHDDVNKTKGFALQYLVECIKRDFGIHSYEGYFIFDADNLLKKDFISKMNDSFDSGEKIITSYRNTKNFDDNWISASYGIHWLRTVRTEHRARSLFHLATRIQGTGFLFASEIIENGWNYTSLTEDRAFCADAVACGYKISYNHDAIFYDEQPVDMHIAMRQRIRWAKGHLQALVETGGTLLSHIFITHGAANKGVKKEETPKWKLLFNNLRLRFMSFDMLTVVFPNSLVGLFRKIIVYALRVFMIFSMSYAFVDMKLAPKAIRDITSFFGYTPEASSATVALIMLTIFFFAYTLVSYVKNIGTAIMVFVLERKRIIPIKWYKKVWFSLTFPIFDLIGKISMVIALFSHVEWKPIPHESDIDISEIEKKETH